MQPASGPATGRLPAADVNSPVRVEAHRTGPRLTSDFSGWDGLPALASQAGAAIELIRRDWKAEGLRAKGDGSPVTDADTAAETIILEGLARLSPDVPVVAEESVCAGRCPDILGAGFFLVDPLDGTREFVGGRSEFTVNIALVREGTPVLGIVYAPALSRMYLGAPGLGAWEGEVSPGDVPAAGAFRQIAARVPGPALTVLASRYHCDEATNSYLRPLPVGERREIGSSLKFCLLAAGEADLYPRFAPTMEWDTAAGQAILQAAGGDVTAPDGGGLKYGKLAEGFRNGAFVARGRGPE